MKKKNHFPVTFKQRLIIINADEKKSKLLQIKKGDPLYYFQYIGFDKDKNIVEYTESYTPCSKTIFSIEAKNKNVD